MKQEALLQLVVKVLKRSDFVYSQIAVSCGGSLDLIARRDDILLLINLSSSSLDRKGSMDLRVLCDVLEASPVIIIVPPPEGGFQDGVLYLKYGIPLMTVGTFYDHLIEGVPPMVFRGPGGHYVYIDPGFLRRGREMKKLSLGALAKAAGVSRKAIQMYEAGMGADMEVALRLEGILGIPLIRSLDPFEYSKKLQDIRDKMDRLEGMKGDILGHLGNLGMEIIPITSCPFDALARESDSLFVTSVESSMEGIRTAGGTLSRISRVARRGSLMIVPRSIKRNNVRGTPVLSVSEVKASRDLDELLELIRRRE